MPHDDDYIARLLKANDRSSSVESTSPLDGAALLATVERRRSRSRTMVSTGAMGAGGALVLLVAVSVVTTQTESPKPIASATDATTIEIDLTELEANVMALDEQIDQLTATVSQSSARSRDLLDIIADSAAPAKQDLSALRSELAQLEGRLASSDAELKWAIEWSRSGALRLELAHQDAASDADRAAKAYRQIAVDYSGTQWGDKAQLALANSPKP